MDTAKQMQMAFMMEEGGLTDDGTTMDPVSGNEVPPGSMAEEVRDDVPAQLSEGEYVVPADVVRFYGVKFFEDLRTEAKRGLMDMEANGRIGGEPVAMTMDNQAGGDLTPEELAALEQVTGMAMGGSVQSPSPYQQPAPVAVGNAMQYNRGGQVLYAAPGVDVSTGTGITNPVTKQESNVDPYKAQFESQQSSMFSPGYLIDQQLGTTPQQVRTVILYPPGGGLGVTLTLPAQQAEFEKLIASGYTQAEKVETTTETAVGRDDGNDQPKPKTTPKEIDVDSIKSEDLAKTAKGLSTMTNIATALASTAGLPVAAFINTKMVAQYNDIVTRMNEEGINTEGLKTKGSIFGGESGVFENLADTSGDGNVNFGDTWLGDLLGFDGEAGVQGDNLRDSFNGSRRTGGDDDTPTPTPSSSGDDTPPTVDTRITDTSSLQGVTEASGMVASEATPTGGYVESSEYGLLNKGGMVKRRKNKKKK